MELPSEYKVFDILHQYAKVYYSNLSASHSHSSERCLRVYLLSDPSAARATQRASARRARVYPSAIRYSSRDV